MFLSLAILISLSFLFLTPLFPPTLRLGTQHITQGAKRRKKENEKERRKENRTMSLCLFLRQQVGDAEPWHSPSCMHTVSELLNAPQGLVGGCLSVSMGAGEMV